MVQRRQRERSLFEVLLPDGHKLWPDWLRKIDTLLEDDAVIEVVAQALETTVAAESPSRASRHAGRSRDPDADPEASVRLELRRPGAEVRANLVYRMFTRIDAGEVPDAKTILKIARALGPEVIEQLHRQVIEVAKRAGVTHGRRFRIDTTVVETNVHYPTDSTLLQDGVRVLTRTMQRASAALGDQPRPHSQSAAQRRRARVLTIGYQARSPKTRDAMVQSYRKLMATTRAVAAGRRHDDPSPESAACARRRPATAAVLQRAQQQLRRCGHSSQRVVAQTRARILGGDTHVPDKVLSVFEPHTDDDPQGQDLEAQRVWQPGHHSRSGTSDHHGVRGARGATGGRHLVDAGAGSPSGDLRSGARSRRRRSRLQLRGERTGGHRPRGAPRDPAAARAEVAGAARV